MSDNNTTPQIKYDVFVSFRGKDIRQDFLSHLVEAFDMKRIYAFVDNKLEKGEKIWKSLVEAIEGSLISLIIFSQGYASSHWCLEELEKIHECKEKYGQIIIPVFYHLEPTHVRYQSSDAFEKAFAKHGKKYESKVQQWRDILKKSADLSGIESSNFKTDAELVKKITNVVLMRLHKTHVNLKRLVGIGKKIADVELLIRKEPEDIRLIGLWGMGGIGKTILAEQVFIKLRSGYGGCLFLANEREQSRKHGMLSLKEKVFSELLGNGVKIDTPNSLPDDIVRRIGRMKVLIVLDDVNDSNHLEKLLGPLGNFGSGSRIIVTTRDMQVLKANKADEVYPLREFSLNQALELFNLNFFNQCDDQREYDNLSKRVVNYAKGIPLVLNELAYLLRARNKEEWGSELDKLEKIPLPEVYDRMKLSYDDLDPKEQQIFLDLAFFFGRSHTEIKVDYLKSLLKKDGESGDSVFIVLERMKDKALITSSKDNFISMHDSLQVMAQEIVRRKSSNTGSHSRWWDLDDIHGEMKNDKVTEAIRSIQINLPKIKEQKLTHHIFAKMSSLKFLKISGEDNYGNDQLILAEELQFSASELRFLCWDHCPLKSLPESFSKEKLVMLKLLRSKIEKLWDGVQNLVNLKEINLSGSEKLKELPDLSKATNLEVLLLRGCSMLTSVHPSVFSLIKLEKLDLYGCGSLTILSSHSICSLSYLNLERCVNLREFSVMSMNMKDLRLGWTKVKELPSSFEQQSKLKLLHLKGSAIERLPSSFNNLTQLLHLEVSNCSNLQTIPELPPLLKTLNAQSCTSLLTLPEISLSIKTLSAIDCKSLETVFLSSAVEQLKKNRRQVRFWNCLNLNKDSLVAIALNAQIDVMKFANQHLSPPSQDLVQNYDDYDANHRSYQVVYVYPGSNVPEWLEYKTTNAYIIIDLSSGPPFPFLGFIFSFVIGEYLHTDTKGRLEVSITISDDESEGNQDSVRMYIDFEGRKIESDHVCVVYDQRCSSFLSSKVKNQTRLKIKVTMGVPDYALPQGYNRGVRFGVSPISTSAYESFIQQMKLRNSISQFH
ncbi:hypothetical protein AAZX31_09G072600 [Glycine max]|uniref:TMV resistance protein N isoform A n=5 Tax=Glycine soja TaxID=3848 RepID=A0A445IY36_GLYSO|nr:protein SUPPRESSOR OF npr1-1, CONSTITUTIVE 1-like isoform X1 [Glycine soja]XP_028180867.1 protein SUPPRESSOR OF npr1-1, CONSTITUTIVE 1-like isoform X1 [Glycine soja]KAH1232382.1 TMV resistance protein N [Glycine max]KAG4990827.1 hypothetical protein JHK87_024284 [Glycine soja]KAH1232383.1 TMV resistance protein N [Glycine max]RZB91090.1 TMV resistance protein N isoform A [Glycine soja]RZB91091.1 TMV resistance protein N isoform B [Glycine soja]